MEQCLLIAERDRVLCQRYRRFLSEWGYQVETSTDGLDCLAKLRQMTPAVLVLDLELLWGGGDGVLAWLHEEYRPPRIPVLLTATTAAPPELTECQEPPVVDYLCKPFALASLLVSIRSAVATPLNRPSRERLDENRDALPLTVPLLAPGLEDDRLAERVERALHATGYGALRTVRVSVAARVVLLEGRVSSFYLKQIAQTTALAVSGAHQIRNCLKVGQPN